PVPTSLSVVLTWNGGTQTTLTYSTAGHNPGDTYLLAPQVASPVAATGVYPYSVRVIANGTGIDRTVSGAYAAVVNANSPFGAGWNLDGLDRLVNISSTTATGLLWVYGSGDRHFFALQPDGSYRSPLDDFGTLVKNADDSYTYTAKDQTQKNFDSNGRLTSIVETHGLALTYSYDGNGRLTGVWSPDGGVTTLTYDANGLSGIQEPGGRALTFTVDASNNLTGLTDADGTRRAFGYDFAHRLTNDQWAPFNATFTYDPGHG